MQGCKNLETDTAGGSSSHHRPFDLCWQLWGGDGGGYCGVHV